MAGRGRFRARRVGGASGRGRLSITLSNGVVVPLFPLAATVASMPSARWPEKILTAINHASSGIDNTTEMLILMNHHPLFAV